MIYENEYNYKIINKDAFDLKLLSSKTDGSIVKEYVLIVYTDNNETKYIEVPNEDYLSKFENIIKHYDVKEIKSSCLEFDAEYKELSYFNINDIYFKKYINLENTLEDNDDKNTIKELFE